MLLTFEAEAKILKPRLKGSKAEARGYEVRPKVWPRDQFGVKALSSLKLTCPVRKESFVIMIRLFYNKGYSTRLIPSWLKRYNDYPNRLRFDGVIIENKLHVLCTTVYIRMTIA